MSPDFSLEIRTQERSPGDFSTHGTVRCVIGGVVVTSDEPEYGIIQSALSLLRSVEADHPPATKLDEFPIRSYLLGHDCGYPIGLGCDNFGTDWKVRHDGSQVVLSDARFIDVPHSKQFDVNVRVPLAGYRRQIVAFATEARRFYFADGPRWQVGGEETVHQMFWATFDELFKRVREADDAD